MSKTKTTSSSAAAMGNERKQRSHAKTGKLARRCETRRLEAIARQVRRISLVEKALKGDKTNKPICSYISTFKKPSDSLVHANITLQKIRGGIPHSQLVPKKEEAVVPPGPSARPSKDKKEKTSKKSKSKYKQKKDNKVKSSIKNQNGDSI